MYTTNIGTPHEKQYDLISRMTVALPYEMHADNTDRKSVVLAIVNNEGENDYWIVEGEEGKAQLCEYFRNEESWVPFGVSVHYFTLTVQ